MVVRDIADIITSLLIIIVEYSYIYSVHYTRSIKLLFAFYVLYVTYMMNI